MNDIVQNQINIRESSTFFFLLSIHTCDVSWVGEAMQQKFNHASQSKGT
jgi:hypothetical protein